MPLKPGDRIDRYVIDGPLGSGGMGEVYRAHDSRLKRAVALKILHTESSAPDPNAKTSAPMSNPGARMLREAQLAASLDHPNVVAIFDVGQLDAPPELQGTTYLAMELIRGEPLRKYIGDASVKMKVRLRWLEEIARALGAAHDAGLVHRDVKPENVMIREDGIVKVLDFGIAKRTTAAPIDPTSSTEGFAVPTMTQQGAVVGTPFYMAPEQLKAEKLDGRADQFAWGVVAYELLTGKAMWSLEGGGYSLVAQILQAPPPSMDAYVNVAPRVAAAVTRALSKDPAARFPSMMALIEELTGRVAGDTDRPPTLSTETSSPQIADARSGEQPSGPASSDTQPAPSIATKRSARPGTLPSPAMSTPDPAPQPSALGEMQAQAPRKRAWAVMAGSAAALSLAAFTAMALRARTTPSPGTTHGTPDAALMAAAGCHTNAECVRESGGKPSVCQKEDGACVALATEGCVVHAEPSDLTNDQTIWFGVRLHPEYIGDPNAIELARRDFAALPSSLPGPGGVRPRRPIGVIECDESKDPLALTKHLVEQVRVPAILGFQSSREAIDMLTSEVISHGTMTMIPLSTSSQVMAIPTPGDKPRLVWRATDSTAQMAKALSSLVETTVEPRLHHEGRHVIDVALVRSTNLAGVGFSDAIVSMLKLNGAGVADNQTHFAEYVVDGDASPDRFEKVQRALATQRPAIVLFYGWEYMTAVFAPLERVWPAGAQRPTYLSAGPFGSFDGIDAGLQKRLLGITTPSNTSVNAKFVLHYNATFPKPVTLALAPNTSYDAFYALAYAAYALGDAPVTGDALAANVKRLVGPGKTIEIGPARILDGLAELGAGRAIDLDGSGSHLDFDLATGEDLTDHVVTCVGKGADGQPIGIESGLTYYARSGSMEGALRCR